ncbi:MAG: nucleoside-diphosphate sugar epimerase/dehydratase, partial [Acidimicrobiales bacterium]
MASDAQPLPYRATASAALVPARQPAASAVVTSGRAVEPVPIRPDGAAGRGRTSAFDPPSRSTLRSRLVAVDVLAVATGWLAVGYALLAGSPGARLAPGLAATAATLVAMRGTGLYRSRLCVRRADELWRVFLSGLWGAAAFVVVQWQVGTPGSEVLAAMAACVVLTGASRWMFARWLRARRAEGRFLRDVVLVGANEDAVSLRTMLSSEPALGYRVTAVVGARLGDPAWRDVRSTRSIGDIPDLAAATGASGILVVPYALSSAATHQAIGVAGVAGLHVQVWPGLRGVGSGRLRNVPVSGEPFFYVEPRPSARWQFALKRAIDVAGAAVVLTVAAPVLA